MIPTDNLARLLLRLLCGCVGAISGIAITPDDIMFLTGGNKITIANAKDGTILGEITQGINAEGVATDAYGNIYASEVFDRSVKKFVRD